MPIPLPEDFLAMQTGIDKTPYPATTKQASGTVRGTLTTVTSIGFTDKILLTIVQNGRLAQWFHVPLYSANPTPSESHLPSSDEDSLLPGTHFTPKPLLGAGSQEREMIGQLYGSQIASAIMTKTPDEKRTLVLGLGLANPKADRDEFFEVVDLVLKCL
ncbi:MAG: hypothetical protein Q9160_001113 [Pyrenula sp. 1 TL-2023]